MWRWNRKKKTFTILWKKTDDRNNILRSFIFCSIRKCSRHRNALITRLASWVPMGRGGSSYKLVALREQHSLNIFITNCTVPCSTVYIVPYCFRQRDVKIPKEKISSRNGKYLFYLIWENQFQIHENLTTVRKFYFEFGRTL